MRRLTDEQFAAALQEPSIQRIVRAVCWRLTRNTANAEDLAQTAFLVAWKYRAYFDAEKPWPLVAWVCGIARKRRGMFWKRQFSLIGDVPATGARPDDEAIRREQCRSLLRSVHRAFRTLRPSWRQVLKRFYYEGSTAKEIAADGGRTLMAVYSQLESATQAFMRAIRKEGVDVSPVPIDPDRDTLRDAYMRCVFAGIDRGAHSRAMTALRRWETLTANPPLRLVRPALIDQFAETLSAAGLTRGATAAYAGALRRIARTAMSQCGKIFDGRGPRFPSAVK